MQHLLLDFIGPALAQESEFKPIFLDYVWVILAMPLLAFVINGLFGRWLKKTAGIIACVLVGISFLMMLGIWYDVLNMPEHSLPYQYTLYRWIPSGDFNIDVAFEVDQLTVVMLFVVLTVGLLVHIYSLGYMDHDDREKIDGGFARFFTFLPLFLFSMLILVLANNFLLLYVGWEAVGLCSYLLIGFWFRKKSAGDASKKAFIVNRIGDFGFGLGIMLLFVNFFHVQPSLTYEGIFHAAETQPMTLGNLTIVCLLLFMGAMGKSAQFPLHVWLPDAMEGPTPVSALIHAATMVTAGVYMVARLNPLFGAAPDALAVVAIIGTTTAILGAFIAITQNDIKRVVAYSTLSQLGYMFAGLGVGAWVAAIFHLMTHAFFKGLLFLGAGSVIHGLHGEQDIRKMGQLRRAMPITFWTFLIGSLANAGLVPLAGFWSKDAIIGGALGHAHPWVGGLLLLSALMTGFYMFRLVFVVFYNKSNVPKGVHPHESNLLMTIPLILLAIGAVFAGLTGILPDGPEAGAFFTFLDPVFEPAIELAHAQGLPVIQIGWTETTLLIMLLSTILAVAGIFFAWLLYYRPSTFPASLAQNFRYLYEAALNKLYFDEFYQKVFVNGGKGLANALWTFDKKVVDGLVNGVAGLVRGSAGGLRRLQTGFVQGYALAIGVGVVALVTYLWIVLPK